MTRIPLRPLARILAARAAGENPDAIERANIRARHEQMRDAARRMARHRLLILGFFFAAGFVLIGGRITALAVSEPMEPRVVASSAPIAQQRADIVDRQGRVLATNFDTHSLYAHPHEIIDKARVAQELAEL
ncbi:MAG: penicillin-binding protein 2, partial [Shimia sp.]